MPPKWDPKLLGAEPRHSINLCSITARRRPWTQMAIPESLDICYWMGGSGLFREILASGPASRLLPSAFCPLVTWKCSLAYGALCPRGWKQAGKTYSWGRGRDSGHWPRQVPTVRDLFRGGEQKELGIYTLELSRGLTPEIQPGLCFSSIGALRGWRLTKCLAKGGAISWWHLHGT